MYYQFKRKNIPHNTFKNKTLNLSLTMILRRNSASKTGGMLDTVCLGEVGGCKRQRGKKTNKREDK